MNVVRATGALVLGCASALFLGAASTGSAETATAAELGALLAGPVQAAANVIAGGSLAKDAVYALADRGVTTIIDLRTVVEGTEDENAAAQIAGIRYVNIPIGREPPTEDQVVMFERELGRSSGGTTVVHCATGVRTGAMWSLYRARKGASAEAALSEGQRIGLAGDYETAIRAKLGLPPSQSP